MTTRIFSEKIAQFYTAVSAPSMVDAVTLRQAAVRARDEAILGAIKRAAKASYRFLRDMVAMIAAYPQRRAAFEALWRLSDRELADIGLNRADLPLILAGETPKRIETIEPVTAGRASLVVGRVAPVAPKAANTNAPAAPKAA